MPEPQLPEDLKRWPQDPYALLGVRPGTPAKEVRRAYSRLIRRYKPEQYPEHFRRIRDAFEAIQRYSQFYYPAPVADEPPSEPTVDQGQSDGSSHKPEDLNAPLLELPIDSYPPVNRRVHRPAGEDTELTQLWERACNGEERDAYLILRERAERPGSSGELYLRLYWLLRIAPEVDPGQSPRHWLVRALRGGGWYGPCRDLYRREVERCPSEALTDRFADLLECQAPLPVLAEWLNWRWQAAATLGRWDFIIEDVETMRPRFTAHLEEDSWARLLLLAVDQLAWSPAAEAERATSAYGAEVERLTHLHNRLDLSRLDILLDLSKTWKKFGVPAGLLGLVPASWTRSPFDLRQPLMAALKNLLTSPERTLRVFDGLRERAPLVFAQLANLIDSISYETTYRDRVDQVEELKRVATEFLELIPSNHVAPRLDFLRFCLREALLPEEALRAMERLPGYAASLSQLRDDPPIRLICVASRWFWG